MNNKNKITSFGYQLAIIITLLFLNNYFHIYH